MQTYVFVEWSRQAGTLLLLPAYGSYILQRNDYHKYTTQSDRTTSDIKSGDTSSSPINIHIQINMASAAEKRMLTAPNSKLAKVDLAVSRQLQRISRTR